MTRWLVPTGLFTLIGIGALWATRPTWQWISENPYEYRSGTLDGPAVTGSIVMILLYAAIVTVAVTVRARTVPLVLLTVALGLTFAVVFLGGLAGAFPSPEPFYYEDF